MLGSHRFGELQRGLPRISRNLLSQRLAWLERAGLVIRTPRPDGRGGDYTLTEAGMQFWPVVQALGAWGHRWATRDARSADLDPRLLMWFLRRRIRSANLPPRKLVVRFGFPGQSPGMFWLILQRSGTDLRDADPGVRVDLWVTADLAALTHVYLGNIRLTEAIKRGLVMVVGPPEYRREFVHWIGISPFATAAGQPVAVPQFIS